MAQQLIFTSAVAGLNPGSSGYCTVARSESMREAVAARLEQWSVYAHAARGPRPVICAHRILNLRGSSFHVLTRIVDSGLDYTGRTNFLAHHIVLQPHEIHGACSPAEVFSNWKGWLKEWEGTPRYLDDTDFSLHAVSHTTRMPASAWEEAAGDAGAAALLLTNGAGHAAAKSVDLIVPAGFEKGLLRLYAESLYLADPAGENAPAVWAIPFTTFLQVENDPADFRWRGLWPEERGRATGGDLCDFVNGHIPPVAADLLADFARTGAQKKVAGPNVASSDLSSILMGQPTTALNSSTAAAEGVRRARRLSAKPRSNSSPSTISTGRGIPRWVWMSLLFVIPAGIAIGWFFEKRADPLSTYARSSTTEYPDGPDHKTPNTFGGVPVTASPDHGIAADTKLADNPFPQPDPSPRSTVPPPLSGDTATHQSAELESLRSQAAQLAKDQTLLTDIQRKQLAYETEHLNTDIGDADIKEFKRQMDEAQITLERNKRAFDELSHFPDDPVYLAIPTQQVVRTGALGLGKALLELNNDSSAVSRLEVLLLSSLFTRDGKDFPLQWAYNPNYPKVQFPAGEITFQEKQIVVACPLPVCFAVRPIMNGMPPQFHVALLDTNAEYPPEQRLQLSGSLFLTKVDSTWEVRESLRGPLLAKLRNWKDVNDEPLQISLKWNLKDPQLQVDLNRLLSQHRQEPEIDKTRQALSNSALEGDPSLNFNLAAIATWIDQIQATEKPKEQKQDESQTSLTYAQFQDSKVILGKAFDAWYIQHHLNETPLPNFLDSGRNYYYYLQDLIKTACSEGTDVSEKILHNVGTKSDERFRDVEDAPNHLREYANDPQAPKSYKEKLLSLAASWQNVFTPGSHRVFIESNAALDLKTKTTVASASIGISPINYPSLLSALRGDPRLQAEIYLQVSLAPSEGSMDRTRNNIRIIDFTQ